MKKEDIVGKVFQHHKSHGGQPSFYFVRGLAKDCETTKDIVIYQALYGDGQIWTRDFEDFIVEVDPDKSDNAFHQIHRFELVNLDNTDKL